MFARIALIVAFALFTTAGAQAADYGACSQYIADAKELIAPPVAVKGVVPLSPNTTALLIAGPTDPDLGESVVLVQKQYQGKMLQILPAASSQWVGIVESVDGKDQPGMWLHVWLEAHGACFHGAVGDRVYAQRGNAPNIFWRDVDRWENQHPRSALVHAE